jgi:hypothetical protein
MRFKLTRRTFLGGLAASLVGVVIGLRLHRGTGPEVADAGQLAGLIHHADSAAVLGQIYLSGKPQEADPDRLAGLVGVVPDPALPSGETGGAEGLRRRVAERIRADFLNDHTVAIDGWVLALTEARLCAMVSVLGNAGQDVSA